MKKILASLAALAFLSACAESKTMGGVRYQPYGLLNQNSEKNECVNYSTSVGNVVWGIFLVQTIVAPVYFFGFALYEPVGMKPNCGFKEVEQ